MEAASQQADPEDELLHQYQQRITREEEAERTFAPAPDTVALNNDVGKKKKKKLKSAAPESDVGSV